MLLLIYIVKDGELNRLLRSSKDYACLSYLWTGSINGIKLQIWATCGAPIRG